MSYEAVVGLEVHAQLLTKSKMFCSCPVRFGEAPNTLVCPVCLGLPGSLPVPNREALAMAIQTALAFHCTIHYDSEFARKNYFYPDLPKNYQISQYDRPLSTGGYIDIETDDGMRRIRLVRIHMEEDAGKSLHEGFHDSERMTYLDFNRAGTPLLEIVSQPDLRSPKEASIYLKKLRQTLIYLRVCDGNMEQGSLRCDANISVRQVGEPLPEYKVELKNLNSFRFVQKALEYEFNRQVECRKKGIPLHQETRLWDERASRTVVMRSKEEAQDYRYFPDPDLLPLRFSQEWVEELQRNMPELPDQCRERFRKVYGLSDYDASLLTANPIVAGYFEDAVHAGGQPKALANWIISELFRSFDFETGTPPKTLPPQHLAELVDLLEKRRISGPAAKQVFPIMLETGESPRAIMESYGLHAVTDTDELSSVVSHVLSQHPDKVKAYREGRTKLFGFFMGQIMQSTEGKADPKAVQEILRKMLESTN